MKTKHKSILKSIFLTSWAALSTPDANGTVSTFVPFNKKEESNSTTSSEELSSTIANGTLPGMPSAMVIEGHSSHVSHSSHSSHTSHTSSSGGSGGSGTSLGILELTNNPDFRTGAVCVLSAAAITGITLLIVHQCKKHKNKKLAGRTNYKTAHNQIKWTKDLSDKVVSQNKMLSLFSENIDVKGIKSYVETVPFAMHDIYQMEDFLISSQLTTWKAKPNYLSINFPELKFARNGQSVFAGKREVINKKRSYYNLLLNSRSFDLSKSRELLVGVGSLLKQKGFLRRLDIDSNSDSIMTAYKDFLVSENIPISSTITEDIAEKLYTLPNKE